MTHAELAEILSAVQYVCQGVMTAEQLEYNLQRKLAALPPEPEQPWTLRERRLYRLLDMAWNGKTHHDYDCPFNAPSNARCVCGYAENQKEIQAALSDTPPPDPRDEALELAALTLTRAQKAIKHYQKLEAENGDHAMQIVNGTLAKEINDALAAIRAARGTK